MIFIFYALQFSIETNHTDDLQPDRFPCHDYFFALKNVTFCGFHPTEQHYLGFITKHPNEERFACHVFQGNGSTRHVAEAIGYSNVKFTFWITIKTIHILSTGEPSNGSAANSSS